MLDVRLYFPVFFLLVACGQFEAAERIDKQKAVSIASEHANATFPQSQVWRRSPIVHDRGDTWVVTYTFPEDSVGGVPTIEISKRTGEVLSSAAGQ